MSDATPLYGQETVQILLLSSQHTDALWLNAQLHAIDDFYFSLSWCDTVAQCEHTFKNHSFDLILWDLQFAQEEIATFLSYLIIESGHKPVIGISAETGPEIAQQLLQRGATDYLSKREISPYALVRSVRYSLYRAAADQQHSTRNQLDSLSGIVDRSFFYDRLHQALLRAERSDTQLSLLILNLDQFKRINESLGYRAGDTLIKMVGARLRQSLRKCDSLARIGGDEFAIILEQIEDPLTTNRVAQKLLACFHASFSLNHKTIVLTASMGVAVYPESGHTTELLMRHGHRAMHEAKHEHGNSSLFFSRSMNMLASRQIELEAEFRHALRSGELQLYYQPKIDADNHHIVGVECLIRWQHPERGLLPPSEFIQAAERSGMIVPMGYWVIERACKDLGYLRDQGFDQLNCSINLSFRQFFDKKLTETVFRIIYNADIDTSCLEFELTESSTLFDQEHTQRCLNELGKLGVSFSMDDFATGYSSFIHLQQLPISTLKIDQSFIENVTSNADDAAIVKAIIQLGHNLRLTVIAEGVETAAQMKFLCEHQIDQIQGHYFSPALALEDLQELLQLDAQHMRRQSI